jgi:hypothetical protein
VRQEIGERRKLAPPADQARQRSGQVHR